MPSKSSFERVKGQAWRLDFSGNAGIVVDEWDDDDDDDSDGKNGLSVVVELGLRRVMWQGKKNV